MRPEILFSLFTPVTSLDGIGPRLAKLVEKVAGSRVVDLLWLLPTNVIDRTLAPSLAATVSGSVATVTVTVDEHRKGLSRRQPYRVHCHDDTGNLTLVFFHAREDYLQKLLLVGQKRVVSGKLEQYGDDLQMVHPDHVVPVEQAGDLPNMEPIYPLAEGLTPKVMRKAIAGALEKLPNLPEWQDTAYHKQRGWPAWGDAVRSVHAPRDRRDLERRAAPRERLAFDELLANQLALALVRANQKRAKGLPIEGDGSLRKKVVDSLPFKMTSSQVQAVSEILSDMGRTERMLRLLQGDVGSGKTLVALMAMLPAVECGRQAALLAPTELLARQHHRSLSAMAEAAGLHVTLLTGRDKGKARAAKLEALASGESHLAVGTHALIQEDVAFHDLAMVVIDEQHRFGVYQRLMLTEKGRGVHVLVMTATPIPRTLQMTSYGDLDVSKLTEKPAGRKPIVTRAMPLERIDDVVHGVARATKQGDRVYWLCPLIEDSEVSDLAAAEERHKALQIVFGNRVGLIHGRMKGPERDAVMEKFVAGNIDILVATTVIEVGVDVPEATIMVIEHTERFGLAQLHQLRGRVGRGERPSSCLLLYAQPLGETARSRINILRQSDDGFVIAEEDLRLRGAGELLGTRQSGFPQFRLADVIKQSDLLATARDDARLIMARDAELATDRGKALRILLYLFERDAAVRLLRSG